MNRQSWRIAVCSSLALHAAMLSLAALSILPRREPAGGGVALTVELSMAGQTVSASNRVQDVDWDASGTSVDFTLDVARLGEPAAAAPSVLPASFVDHARPIDPPKVVPAVAEAPASGVDREVRPASAVLPAGPAASPGVGRRTQTAIFGVPGEGTKFVYVFDRSASTGGPQYNTLAAAKAQLIQSLEGLQSVHQFQIIFYNQTPTVFTPGGRSWGLCAATPQNKLLARRFIGSITPDGSTSHLEALRLAIGLRPDVIFFLTDGDEPRLSAEDLEAIRLAAGAISINTIEFGAGPPPAVDDFLMLLARQNRGAFGYIDVSRLGATDATYVRP